jgi:hypothetical protein
MAVGAVAGVVVIGVAVYALSSGGGGPLTDIIDPGPETPTLAFGAVSVAAEPTTATRSSEIDVDGVGREVEEVITGFYQAVWIDPDVWGGGGYADAFDEYMAGDAPAAAGKKLESLTLGADAGATYEFVTPERNRLSIRVLTDGKDHPAQVIAQVIFRASAEHTDGTFSDITQTASYFLADLDGDWRIISFDATRIEEEGKAPASETPTVEAT